MVVYTRNTGVSMAIRQKERRACKARDRISKSTFLVMINDRQKEFFAKMDIDDWTITSFNAYTRDVCIVIKTNTGVNNINIILPALTVDSNKC